MCVIGLCIVIATVWMVKVAEAVEAYHLDNRNVCHSTGVITKWLGDDDVIIIYGKLDPDSSFTECEMVFGPGTSATKLSTVVQFQTYLNQECNVYLLLDQSPYQFFDKDVSTVVNLTCFSTPGATKFYTDAGSNLRIKLHKSRSHLRNYNFIFNITLTDHKTVTEVSSVIIIIIGIIIAITVPLIGCIVYKALKIKRWSKRHYTSDADLSPQVHQALQSFDGHSTPPSVRYLSMPLGVQDGGDIIHSQTCIVGRQRADGRCTVCNRSHEDFAHVVDVDSHGIVVDDAPHGGLCHRSHEDFVHFEEINTSHSQVQGEGQRLLGRIGASSVGSNTSSRPANRHLNAPTGCGADTRHDIDDDDEIDVSGNDLIPPSYDLCPPSYDEAIDMPTPGGRATNTSSQQQQPERDPLYQNIDDILTNR